LEQSVIFSLSGGRASICAGLIIVALGALDVAPAAAQTAPAAPVTAASPGANSQTGSLEGVISDAAQHPVPGVTISAKGAVTRSTSTDAAGSFALDGLPAGSYSVNITKAGFTPVVDTVTVTAGAITNAKLQLSAASFSSIAQIGRVSANRSGANTLNTSTAAVATISGETFIDQGQLNVNRALNEVPGVVIGVGSGFAGDQIANGASPLVTGIPQLRGSLPYETESLIDGHPISIGVYGTFNPTFINPNILQDVEVVKGPGASAPNINYAIGGTVNFVTLEPTRTNRQSFDLGVDQFGGQNANVRATGTAGKLGYAIDYAAQGTQGPSRGFDPLDPINLSNGALVNGKVACGNPLAAAGCFPSVVAIPGTNFAAQANLTAPLDICCPQEPLESNSRNDLAKLRYNFTPSTSFTLTYVGGQTRGSAFAADLFTYPSYFFGPPAGYTGTTLPAGADNFQNNQGDSQLATNANLYEAELHTVLGPATLLARYYVAADNTNNLEYGQGPTPGQGTVTGLLYGGVPLGNDTTPTFFNGTPGTVTLLNSYVGVRTKDKLNGFTVEGDLPAGNNVYSISYDAVSTQSSANTTYSIPAEDIDTVPAGSGQKFQTIRLQGQFALTTNTTATLSNYLTSYTDRYTQDFGATFQDATHAYDAPRLAFAWRPTPDWAVRASTGFSIAPPYIDLLTNSLPVPNRTPPTNFQTTANSGDISPETAFGFDFGADRRIARNTILSFDAYQTNLHNQFLETQQLEGTITEPAGNPYGAVPGQQYPLYVSQTRNLGHSRMEGIELALHRDPLVGIGYKLQGELMRAYAYDLPAGFYNTASGPDTANLGILPNENFGTTGQGYNGLSQSRVPYSQGYAEFNVRSHNGSYFLVGVTYFGPNNAYNEPPFGVVNTSFRQPLTKHSSLLFAITNVTSAYSNFEYNIYGGIPTPLVNGMLGFTAGNVIGPSTASVTLHVDM
jgi:hypothetical protein